jgi:hypothetical protein
MKLASHDRALLHKMAYSRQQFKNRVEEKVGGALLEFYKAECAQANGFTRWVQHWRTEVERLLGELEIVLIHEIRGFRDRNKAFDEVIQYVQGNDRTYRKIAANAVTRNFKAKRLRHGVPAAATETFYAQVTETARNALEDRPEERE